MRNSHTQPEIMKGICMVKQHHCGLICPRGICCSFAHVTKSWIEAVRLRECPMSVDDIYKSMGGKIKESKYKTKW